jgi:cytochrome oxidase assembly protein ShyY1
VLRTTLATLRQPRYVALTIVMVFVALVCVGAGTWQIVRFVEKVRANDALTANAHDAAVPVRAVLPLVGGHSPSADAVRFRSVVATGTYDPSAQGLVRLRSVGGIEGFYVLTPLRTSTATLLIVRGFMAALADGSAPSDVPAPPSGVVSVRAQAEAGETKTDLAGGLPSGQLLSINPADQAGRLGGAVFNGYADLKKGEPGTRGLTVIPPPSLSNPAGGAVEPQHFAYIIQWYLFALLALAAPLAMARAERRESQSGDTPELAAEEQRAAKLADRYGRAVR